MDTNAFINRIRSLWNIDKHDVPWMTAEQWAKFSADPPAFLIRCDDTAAASIVAIVEARQKAVLDTSKTRFDSAYGLLCKCFDAFDDEEESVKEEHAGLIEKLDTFIEEVKASGEPKPTTVTVAIFDHKYGQDVCVFADPDGAEEWRQAIAQQWWEREIGDDPKPASPKEAADAYWDRMRDHGEEFFSTEECEVQ